MKAVVKSALAAVLLAGLAGCATTEPAAVAQDGEAFAMTCQSQPVVKRRYRAPGVGAQRARRVPARTDDAGQEVLACVARRQDTAMSRNN